MIQEMLLLTVNPEYYSKIYYYCIITNISTFLFRIYHYYFTKLSVNKYFVFLQKRIKLRIIITRLIFLPPI
jgi:hypothetical protein